MAAAELDQDAALTRIAHYEEQRRAAHDAQMQIDDNDDSDMELRLDKLIAQYEELLGAQKQMLRRLQDQVTPLETITTPSTSPLQRSKQLQSIQEAYQTLRNSKPDLPEAQSVLPVFLAVQDLNESVSNGRCAIQQAIEQLDSKQQHAKSEEADLSDGRLLLKELQNRNMSLEKTQKDQADLTPEVASKNLLNSKALHRKQFEAEAKRLSTALSEFVDQRLSALVAAEELGGPVAGELPNIEDDALTAGFSSQGNPKSKLSKQVTTEQRQKRIDDIWGSSSLPNPVSTEHEAAGLELSQLVRDLVGLANSNPGSYFDLKRDSAACRFLVRAKVAQYHPKDARRLRLLDFGRELAD